MAKNDNLTDFLTDVADAIRAKKGTTSKINPQDFSSEIASIETGGGGGDTPSRPKWTGHADAEGLRAIGWTDEDIAYYQEHGVNWNAEDDEYHKVTDDNKALYGVLTANNISTYRDRIVYLPKIDTSSVTSMNNMFYNCLSLVSIPLLDTSGVTSMNDMFNNCYSLVSIPQLDTSSVTSMKAMFYFCPSLTSLPLLDTSYVRYMNQMFFLCYSIVAIPLLDARSARLNEITRSCNSLTYVNIKNIKESIDLGISSLLSKESLLYLINNEAATSAITITLAPYAYERLANDADVVAALANHPNISIAQ